MSLTIPPPPNLPKTLSAAPPPIATDESPVKVLVADDEPGLRRSLARILLARGFQVETAEDGAAALEYIENHAPDVVLVDLMMPRMGGLELLSRVKDKGHDCEVIIMTAFADVDAAVTAGRAGAYHFLTKPFPSNDAVALLVTKAAEHRRLVDKAKKLEQRIEAQERFGELIGTSPKMAAVYQLIEGVAASTSTVLILGESGTGKELVARAIHQRSVRAGKPFVAVNCAAIPKDLVESELFGHIRGAFTGAQNSRAGLFETAHGGTIFLDEVGDLPLAAQVKLLRTLQEGEVKRVGADDTKVVDVRVLAATNVDLRTKIAAGTFRKDLFYRLNVIAISLPPLRQREDDVALLTYHFVQKYSRRMLRDAKKVSSEAMRALREYAWPGNVRELEHAIEHAVVLSQGDVILPHDLPFVRQAAEEEDALGAPPSDGGAVSSGRMGFANEIADLPYADAKKRAMALFDKTYVGAVMRRTGGNLSEAARQAGLDRSNFRRIVRKAKTG